MNPLACIDSGSFFRLACLKLIGGGTSSNFLHNVKNPDEEQLNHPADQRKTLRKT